MLTISSWPSLAASISGVSPESGSLVSNRNMLTTAKMNRQAHEQLL